jgi:hypothetical protein
MHFEELAKKLKLKNQIIEPKDLLFNEKYLIDDLENIGPFDYLVVNSVPLSGQFNGINQLDHYSIQLSKMYKIITTRKIQGICCTLDYKLSLYQIGCLSKKCKNLLMVSTGPSWFCLNTKTFKESNSILLMLEDEYIEIGDKIKTIRNLQFK